jgi:hypothetical protein
MSETRRDALKLSVLGALGLGACTGGNQKPLIQPVVSSSQPDILVNVDQANNKNSWVLLQYDNQNSNYQVSSNQVPLYLVPGLGNRPDLAAATQKSTDWLYYNLSDSVTIQGTDAKLKVTRANPGDVASFAQNANVAQNAWNEIGKK